MGKSRDIADGTRYVDVSGDTMTGNLLLPNLGVDTDDDTKSLRLSANATQATSGVAIQLWGKDVASWGGGIHYLADTRGVDGSHRFWTWDGSAFVNRATIDEAGRVTTPYQPRFHATKGDGHIYSTRGVITFNLIARNNGNNFNGTRFTCPVSGDYFFYFHCHSENTTGEGQIGLRINGNPAWGGSQYTREMDGNAAMTPITVNLIHSLSAGDYVELDNFSLIIWAGDSSSGVTFGGYLMG